VRQPARFYAEARNISKKRTAGMRQVGVLAAAGLVALEQMTGRLAEDHARAARLADGLSQIPGVRLNPSRPSTNMVFLDLEAPISLTAAEAAERLKARGVQTGVVGSRRFRLVTHYWIDDAAVEQAVAAFREILQK